MPRAAKMTLETAREHIDTDAIKAVGERFAGSKRGWPKYLDVDLYLERALRYYYDFKIEGPGKAILEIGSGPGYFAAVCALHGNRPLCLDIPNAFYDALRSALGLNSVHGGVEAMMPLKGVDGRYDVIVVLNAVFHRKAGREDWGVAKWRFFIDDMLSRLVDGGRLILIPNRGEGVDSALVALWESMGEYNPVSNRTVIVKQASVKRAPVKRPPVKRAPVKPFPINLADVELSVVVTSCERVPAFRKLAERLAIEDLHQVTVMDNSRTPEARQAIAELSVAHGFRLEQWEFEPYNMCKLRNHGLDTATGDVVVMFDSDIVPLSGDFFGKIRAFHRNNKALLIHSRYKEGDSTKIEYDAEGEPTIADRHRTGLLAAGKRPWRASSSGNCSIRRDVLGDIRFDEQYSGAAYHDDTDWTRQIWDSRIPIKFDNTICANHETHPASTSDRQINRRKFQTKWRELLLPRYAAVCQDLGVNGKIGVNAAERCLGGEDLDRETHDCLKVLDIGCGKGLLAHYLSCRYGVEVNALDPYDNSGHRAEDEGVNETLKTRTRDAVRIEKCHLIDFKPVDRFDYVLADISLHHIAHTREPLTDGEKAFEYLVASLQVAYDAMRDGGKFVAIEVNPIGKHNVHYHQHCVIGNVRPGTKHYATEWIHALTRVGFENFSVNYFWPSVSTHPKMNRINFAAKMARYAYKYRIVATKGENVEATK